MSQQQSELTPVADDLHATTPELLDRAAADYRLAHPAPREDDTQGGAA